MLAACLFFEILGLCTWICRKLFLLLHFASAKARAKTVFGHLKSLYGFGGRCLKIRDVCVDFKPYFKVHNLVSVHPKSIILGQMTNLNMTFHVVLSVYRFIKIWNSAQFPAEFRNGQWTTREAKERDPGNEVDSSPVIRIVRTNQVSHGIIYNKNNFLYLLIKMEIYLYTRLWWMFSISRCNSRRGSRRGEMGEFSHPPPFFS